MHSPCPHSPPEHELEAGRRYDVVITEANGLYRYDLNDVVEVVGFRQIGRLPVVDDEDRLVGVVTLSSMALRARDKEEALETAQEVSRRSARASAG